MASNSNFAFYGTLRKGMANYELYKADLRLIKTVILAGFKMYDALGYPYAIRSQDLNEKIVVDLMEIITEKTKNSIYDLEINSGYFLDSVYVQNEKFGIYLYSQNFPHDPRIENGDWTLYVNS